MPPTSTASRPSPSPASQPDFWKRYSPHGECPISFTASLLIQAAVVVFVGLVCVSLGDNDSSKPPEMDVVEIEGGGGLGDLGVGPGKLNTGEPGRHEGVETARGGPSNPTPKIKDFQLKELAKKDLTLQRPDDPKDSGEGDPFAAIDREKAQVEQLLANEAKMKSGDKIAGFKGGDKTGSAGGAGGPGGKGSGKGKGQGQGNKTTGGILTDQRMREGRWFIHIDGDGDLHIKKLQALKVLLIVVFDQRTGEALRYDFSKPMPKGEAVVFKDDRDKCRWSNRDPRQMMAIAKGLRLAKIPQVSVFYLSPELEAEMLSRDLAFKGRQENEIQRTDWEVRERDGSYENVPSIYNQDPRPGVK